MGVGMCLRRKGSRIVCPDCLSSVTNPTGVKGLGSEPGSGDAATDHSKDGTTCKDSPAAGPEVKECEFSPCPPL